MKLKNIILALSFLMGGQAFAMQAPVQKPIQYSKNILLDLPTDIKSYLLPFVLQGNEIEMKDAIVALASTSKEFNKMVNNPQVMLALLNAAAKKLPSCGDATALAQQLCLKGRALPVMENPLIAAWMEREVLSFVIKVNPKFLVKYVINFDLIQKSRSYSKIY